MKIAPDRKFLIVTFDPAVPALKVPVGKAGTIEAAKKVVKSLAARANGWVLEILAAPEWAPVAAEG